MKKNKDIFNESEAKKLLSLARINPGDAHEKLQAYLGTDFTLTIELLDSESYNNVVEALGFIASGVEYFESSTDMLWRLSDKEGQLGYFGEAVNKLEALFTNPSFSEEISLEKKMECLRKTLTIAEDDDLTNTLDVFVKILAVSASIDPSQASNPDLFFEKYINFCINALLRLSKTFKSAEEKLYELLDSSIDKQPIVWVKKVFFIILRGYINHLNNKGTPWDPDPFLVLKKLEEKISNFKKDGNTSPDLIKLKLWLKQLNRLRSEREIIAKDKDFVFYLGAKKSDKIAKIDVDVDNRSGLNLHERQSLAERLIFIQATNIHSIPTSRAWPKTTYVIGSFGMVITDRPHKKNGVHKRKFKTIPIQSEDLVITGANGTGHAEEALYAFLLEKSRVYALLEAFKQRYGISAIDHKVYAVVLDLHGTYDMCLSCSKKGLDFQNAFRELLLECFEKHHLKALTSHPELLPIVVRYSSDIKYDYLNATVDQYKGILTMYQGQAKREFSSSPNGYDKSRDIKYRDPNLLVHGTTGWHALWNSQQKRQGHKDKDLPLESWTAFVPYSTYSSLTSEAKHFNYTRLGLVETFVPPADPSVQAVQEDLAAVKINCP